MAALISGKTKDTTTVPVVAPVPVYSKDFTTADMKALLRGEKKDDTTAPASKRSKASRALIPKPTESKMKSAGRAEESKIARANAEALQESDKAIAASAPSSGASSARPSRERARSPPKRTRHEFSPEQDTWIENYVVKEMKGNFLPGTKEFYEEMTKQFDLTYGVKLGQDTLRGRVKRSGKFV